MSRDKFEIFFCRKNLCCLLHASAGSQLLVPRAMFLLASGNGAWVEKGKWNKPTPTPHGTLPHLQYVLLPARTWPEPQLLSSSTKSTSFFAAGRASGSQLLRPELKFKKVKFYGTWASNGRGHPCPAARRSGRPAAPSVIQGSWHLRRASGLGLHG